MKLLVQDARQHIEQFVADYPQGVVVLWWATTTWKTALSLALSEFFSCEIISADSRQVYIGMDIGTDKVSPADQERVPHHGLDLVTPEVTYTAGQRKSMVEEVVPKIHARGALPVIVWGTWLYIDMIYKNFSLPNIPPQNALREELYAREAAEPGWLHQELQRLDPDEAYKHHPNSLPYLVRALEICLVTGEKKSDIVREQPVARPLLMYGLWREKEATNRRINKRIVDMIDLGLIDEVRGLLDAGYGADAVAMQGIGYKEIVAYLMGEVSLDKAIEQLKRNTHYLWKKQRTWMRRYLTDARVAPKDRVTYHCWHFDA